MTDFSPQDVARIAASLRLAGEMLEAHGTRALAATPGWGAGPKSAALDPTTRGNPPDPDDGIIPDPDRDTAQRLRHLIETVDDRCYELRRILHAVAGTAVITPEPDTPAQVSAGGWCVSCWRLEKPDGSHVLEPVAVRPDGRRRYRDHCRRCGEYVSQREELAEAVIATLQGKAKKDARRKLASGDKLPPLELVKLWHEGRRVTQQMVEAAVARSLQKAA